MKIASLNIYGGALLEKAIKSFTNRGIEALCLQEVNREDIPKLQKALGLPFASFCPMWNVLENNPYGFKRGRMGTAILSKHPAEFKTEYYDGSPYSVPIFNTKNPNNSNRALQTAEIDHPTEGKILVGTTHFTWTPDGKADDQQRTDLTALIKILQDKENLVLMGDMNAPRGGEIFIRLSNIHKDRMHNLLTDRLPKFVETTIDSTVHRNKALHLVVDVLLTSPNITTHSFETVNGVSDHIGLITQVKKNHPKPKPEQGPEPGLD